MVYRGKMIKNYVTVLILMYLTVFAVIQHSSRWGKVKQLVSLPGPYTEGKKAGHVKIAQNKTTHEKQETEPLSDPIKSLMNHFEHVQILNNGRMPWLKLLKITSKKYLVAIWMCVSVFVLLISRTCEVISLRRKGQWRKSADGQRRKHLLSLLANTKPPGRAAGCG